MSAIPIPPIDWALLAPMLWLAGGGIVVTLLAVGPRSVRPHTGYVALASLALPAMAAMRLWDLPPGAESTLAGMVLMDHFAIVFQMLFLATAALTILVSLPTLAEQGVEYAEYYCLILFATAGMMLMASSSNLLILFLGLEVLSLPLYVLVGFTRWQDRSLEASMKYFLLGAFSTGFTIYGMALMYAATGTLDLNVMRMAVVSANGAGGSLLLLVGFGLAMVGFLFKIAAFPFQYWLPDVYQGAPTSVTAFMIAGTKAAAFAAMLRILTAPLFWEGPFTSTWVKLLTVLAALTMTAGNLVALVQTNIKRMLAYSSIAHAGYLLIAVVARSDDGLSSVVFYLAAYLFMNLGAFAVVLAIDRSRGSAGEGDFIASYAGLGRRHAVLAAAMALFMLSLTGIPLTAGFLGKFYIFRAAVDSHLYGLAVVGLLNSALAAAYYLNVVLTMYMKEPVSEPPAVTTPAVLGLGIAVSAAGVLYLGVFPARVLEFARNLLL
ncbi:MAG TPA: NADH-quinone oxidoreductase subunit N [Candidatus Polarisedimenticolia bacterium]|nr:NADH-quinone oxidoreductase subunit N [Candidatus Polarisedimenticolia bacterium]